MSSKDFNLIVPKEITGKTLQFDSVQGFQTWIQQEQNAFEWVSQLRLNFSNHIWTHVTAQFQAVQSQIQIIKQITSMGQPFDGNVAAIHSWFVTNYSKSKNLILSTSSEYKAVLDLKELNSVKAAVFFGHILALPLLYKNGVEKAEMIEGSFEYFQYRNGVSKKDLSAEKQALGELKKEWDQHLTDYNNKEDKLKTDFETTKANFDNYFKDTQKNISDHLTKHTADLDELKKTYDQFMALKAPVDYWSQKREEHIEKVSKFRNWILGVGILGGAILLVAVYYIFSDGVVNYWKIGFFILLATLFFWAMRVLAKLLLSNIHLEGDANERVVMSQTYLALLREKSGFSDSDKKLILATLFRPSSSGIIGDDGIPPGIYDIVSKLVSR